MRACVVSAVRWMCSITAVSKNKGTAHGTARWLKNKTDSIKELCCSIENFGRAEQVTLRSKRKRLSNSSAQQESGISASRTAEPQRLFARNSLPKYSNNFQTIKSMLSPALAQSPPSPASSEMIPMLASKRRSLTFQVLARTLRLTRRLLSPPKRNKKVSSWLSA